VLAGTGEVVSLRDVGVGTVDSVVVDGQSEVDESSLTGESFPVPKLPSSEVWAGTMNMDGKSCGFFFFFFVTFETMSMRFVVIRNSNKTVMFMLKVT